MRGPWVVVVAGAACVGACYGDEIEAAPDAWIAPDHRDVVRIAYLADDPDLSGIPVFFQNADSSLVMATTTNAQGRANALMNDGGFVTLALGNGEVFTYAEVRAGDELVVDQRSSNTGARAQISLRVPASENADAYELTSTCGDQYLPRTEEMVTATLFGCGGEADLVVKAWRRDPQPTGSNWKFLYKQGAVIDPQTPLVIEGEYQAMEEAHVALRGMTAAPSRAIVQQMLVANGRSVTEARGVTVDVVDVSAPLTGRIPRMYVPPTGTTLTRVTPVANDEGAQTTLVWGPSQADIAIDTGAVRLRPYLEKPVLDMTSTRVTWTEGDGVPGDLAMLNLMWRSADNHPFVWRVLAPRHDAPVIRYPVLPVARLQPTATTEIGDVITFAFGTTNADARTTLLGAWPREDARVVDGTTGRVDYQSLAVTPK